jgi:glutathione S-transferase
MKINSWLDFAQNSLNMDATYKSSIGHLDKCLMSKDYLVGSGLTIADFAVYAILKQKFTQDGYANLEKYFNTLSNNKCFQMAVSLVKEVWT